MGIQCNLERGHNIGKLDIPENHNFGIQSVVEPEPNDQFLTPGELRSVANIAAGLNDPHGGINIGGEEGIPLFDDNGDPVGKLILNDAGWVFSW